jgi:hypothetical protein
MGSTHITINGHNSGIKPAKQIYISIPQTIHTSYIHTKYIRHGLASKNVDHNHGSDTN